ncbi:DUF3168 domain-containing protein [Jannaschia donghaensis]|uniref:Gene transfer agent protein n=1 Tax=Jannaschia donghaensis TaxID=420998 RepID=A0A0M6YKL4_9RHOB|nr:DUF3168 domain-containing protein [Jannaschia donghaensis]CTQ50908.1 hypothetical protein JDO7802_02939 [Jannaschia donghaensis]
MTYAAGESLQTAIFGRLIGDPVVDALLAGAVFDDVPTDAPDLFVAIGPEKTRGVADSGGHGAVHQLQISVVTRREGYLAAKTVAVAVSDALSSTDLTLARGRLVSLRFVRAEARRDKTEGTRRIDLIFRARTDDTGL